MKVGVQKAIGALVIAGVVSAIACSAVWFDLFRELESRLWDSRMRFVADTTAHNKKIKLLVIDQSSLEHFARNEKIYWPWPRSLYNPVLLFLQQAQAKGVAFDLLFTENSGYVDDDKEFATTVAQSIPVVGSVAVQEHGSSLPEETLQTVRGLQAKHASYMGAFVTPATAHRYEGGAVPFPELISALPYVGSVTAVADSDKVYRRVWAGVYLKDVPLLSLPFSLFQATGGSQARGEEIRRNEGRNGSHLVRFFGPAGTYDTYSIHAVIESWIRISEGRESLIPLDEFKDAYVFIGATAPGLLDLRPTPFEGSYPGVELNATVLDNLIANSFMTQVHKEIAVAMTCGMVAVASSLVIASMSQLFILSATLIVGWAALCYYAAHLGWWIPMLWPLVGIVVTVMLVSLLRYQVEGRQHMFVKRAFKHYVSPEVIEQIIANPQSLALGGERRELTIFFSDIEGFTSLSEQTDPAKLTRLLNRFLSEMSSIVLAHGGTIDKYQGDAVIAFWNAPLPVDGHARRALEAAIACNQRLKELEPVFAEECGRPLKMRIGLHTGIVSVGNFGSSSRFNYTMIGDAANLASRLEGVNKVFGSFIAISGETRAGAPDLLCRKLGDVRVVGKDRVVEVFEPMAVSKLSIEQLPRFNQALQLFYDGRRNESLEIFSELSTDPVSKMYCRRIAEESETLASPVWNLTSK